MNVRKSITVARPPEVAFKVFCEEIGKWWPLHEGISFGGERAKDIFIENRVGGRFFERFTDGTECEVGRVTTYQPPSRVAFTWRPPDWDATTQVDIRFTAEGAGTRVELEHSGWEQSAKVEGERGGYDKGWDFVLRRFLAGADASV